MPRFPPPLTTGVTSCRLRGCRDRCGCRQRDFHLPRVKALAAQEKLQVLFQKTHTAHSYPEHSRGSLARAKPYSCPVHLPPDGYAAEHRYQKGTGSRVRTTSRHHKRGFLARGARVLMGRRARLFLFLFFNFQNRTLHPMEHAVTAHYGWMSAPDVPVETVKTLTTPLSASAHLPSA